MTPFQPKIVVDSYQYAVRIRNAPGFGASVHVTIQGRMFESVDWPAGFVIRALEDLMARVRLVHPSAVFA